MKDLISKLASFLITMLFLILLGFYAMNQSDELRFNPASVEPQSVDLFCSYELNLCVLPLDHGENKPIILDLLVCSLDNVSCHDLSVSETGTIVWDYGYYCLMPDHGCTSYQYTNQS